MKLIVYVGISVFQLLFAYGIHLLNYFTKKKLGMNRWVVYHNMQINRIGVINLLKYGIILAIILCSKHLIKFNLKYIKTFKLMKFDIVVLLIINIILIFITVLYNSVSQKLYFFYIIILLLVYILQVVKILLNGNKC